jgi:hypothetical protein
MLFQIGYQKLANLALGAANRLDEFFQEGIEEKDYSSIERFSVFLRGMHGYYKRNKFIPPMYGLALHKAINATEVLRDKVVGVEDLAKGAKALGLELADYQNLSVERAKVLRDFSNRVYDHSTSVFKG